MISQWLMHHDGLEAVDPVELRGEPRWQGRRFAWPPPLFPLRRRAPLPALLLLRRLPPAIHRLVIRLPPPRQPSPVATGGNVRRRRAQDRECQHLVHHRRRRRRDRTTSRRKTWRVGLNFASNLWLLALIAQVANGGGREIGDYIYSWGGEDLCCNRSGFVCFLGQMGRENSRTRWKARRPKERERTRPGHLAA